MTERWQEQSLCAETDPELFFAEKGEAQKVKLAKAICARCDVFPDCQVDTLAHPQKHGVRAGMTPRQVQNAIKKANREAA